MPARPARKLQKIKRLPPKLDVHFSKSKAIFERGLEVGDYTAHRIVEEKALFEHVEKALKQEVASTLNELKEAYEKKDYLKGVIRSLDEHHLDAEESKLSTLRRMVAAELSKLLSAPP